MNLKRDKRNECGVDVIDLLKANLPESLYWIIVQYVGVVCYLCGSCVDLCDCWIRAPLYVHPLSEIYNLDRWCVSCQELKNCHCTCYRVREMRSKIIQNKKNGTNFNKTQDIV
jgi:hypothetical protein